VSNLSCRDDKGIMLTIKTKLTLSHLFAVLLVATGISFTVHAFATNFLADSYKREMVMLNNHLAGEVRNFLENRQQILERLALAREVEDFPEKFRIIALARHFALFSDVFPVLRYFNSEGIEEVKVVRGDTRETHADLGSWPLYHQTRLRPNEVILLDGPASAEAGSPSFALGLGIRKYFDDRFVGGIIAEFPVPPLQDFADISPAVTPTIWLLDKEMTVLAASPGLTPTGAVPPFPLPPEELRKLLASTPRSGAIDLDLNSGAGSIARSLVPETEIQVVSFIRRTDLIAPAVMLRNIITAIGVVFGILAAVIVLFLVNDITRPLKRLTRAVTDLASGSHERLDLKRSNDEIGQLAAAFNRLVDDLERTTVSRQYFEGIIQSMHNGLFILTPERRVKLVNHAGCLLLGLSDDRIVGRPLTDFIDPGAGGATFPATPADGKSTLYPLETTFRNRDNEPIPVLSSCTPLLDGAGRLSDLVCVAQDLTERKLLESQLRQAHKMEAIGTLAGGIAHDFNNILTAILGYAELAMLDPDRRDHVQEALETIYQSGQRARNLVKQLLTFSRRSEEQRLALRIQPIIQETLKLLRSTTPSAIEIRKDIDPECGAVVVDPSAIHQLLLNLCNNAIHAMKEKGGVLAVELAQTIVEPGTSPCRCPLAPGAYVRLGVTDTGHGMAPEIAERIFEPFFTTKDVGEGTGLGLSVVHGVVTDLGGKVCVDSRPGEYTRFDVYLPVSESTAIMEPEETPVLHYGSGSILVVEDEEAVLAMLKDMLGHLGYRVTAQSDSRRALEDFRADPGRHDLVITDQDMPGLTGLALAGEMLKLRPDLRVILYSGYSEQTTNEKVRAAGIREFLLKPLNMQELAARIKEVMANP